MKEFPRIRIKYWFYIIELKKQFLIPLIQIY